MQDSDLEYPNELSHNPIWDCLWLPVGIFLVCLTGVLERQIVWWGRILCAFAALLLAIPALIGYVAVEAHDRLQQRSVSARYPVR
jgi:hypothetical protein